MALELEISSPHNPRLKAAAKLRDRAARREQGRFLIDGAREISRAVLAGHPPEEIFVQSQDATLPEMDHFIQSWREQRIPVHLVAVTAFTKLAYGERASGCVAVAKIWPHALAQLQLPPQPLVVVVEGLEKPGNLGALLRTANAAGVAAVIATGDGTDWFNPNTVRASVGAIFAVPIATASSAETQAWLTTQGLRVFAARVDAAVPYTNISYREPCALVLGSEAHGLGESWTPANSQGIFIPMQGVVDSLNVSVTAAILCYEAHRQRHA